MFEFSTTARIIFGSGSFEQLPEVVHGLGRRVLLVTGANSARANSAQTLLLQAKCEVEVFRVFGEPNLESIQRGIAVCRSFGADVVVGFGGGSALDSAKAIAAVSTNPGELLDYLEVVGRGQAFSVPGLACVAMPTTAGTGAEVTRNAVIDVPAQATKVSLRGPQVLPRVAIVDPRLALTVPASVTAATGFDALTQVIEPFLSNRHNPMTDALAREGMRLAARALPRAYANVTDLSAREDMALVSLLGGLCLANSGLGAVHGLAGPLGGLFHAPHGALCAALLAQTLAVNLKALKAAGPDNQAEQLDRYREVGQLLNSSHNATAEDGLAWIAALTEQLQIPKLSSYGVQVVHFDGIVERAMRASSMQYNAVKLSAEELAGVLRASL